MCWPTIAAYGRLKGTFGGSGLTRGVRGGRAKKRCRRRSISVECAGFVYEELTVAARDVPVRRRASSTRASSRTAGCRRATSPTSPALSGCSCVPPTQTTVALSVARASRNPALEELYFNGPHPGNFAFESRESRASTRNMRSVRPVVPLAAPRARPVRSRTSGTTSPTTSSATRPVRSTEDFPVIEFEAADSVLQGIEAHLDVPIAHAGVQRGGGIRSMCVERCSYRRSAAAADSAAARTGGSALSTERVPGGGEVVAGRPSRIACSARRRRPTGINLLKLFSSRGRSRRARRSARSQPDSITSRTSSIGTIFRLSRISCRRWDGTSSLFTP